MERKVIDFINMDPNRYVSLKSIKQFYWCISIIWVCMLVFAIVGKIMFSLVFTITWSVFYWIFVCILQNKKIKKSFELRFLVNGIAGIMTSALFWGVFTTIQILLSNQPILKTDHYIWTLLAYILFSVILIAFTVVGVHKGIYGKMKRNNMSKRAIIIESVFAAILPFSGLIGMYTSKFLRSQVEASVQTFVACVCGALLIFLPGLAHINFVQYYYCKKYGITSSEDGQTTSPLLEPTYREKIANGCRKNKNDLSKANKPLSMPKKALKIILLVLMGIASLFALLFLVFFVKIIISKM